MQSTTIRLPMFILVLVLLLVPVLMSAQDSISTKRDSIPIAPTAAELKQQAERIAKLEAQAKTVEENAKRVTQLQIAIEAKDSIITSMMHKATEREKRELEARQRALEEERKSLEQEKAKKIQEERELRSQTVIEWASMIDLWRKGLNTTKTSLSIADITIIFRPEDAGSFDNILDNVGRLAAVGGLLASTSDNNDTKKAGLWIASGGLLTHFAINAIQSYIGGDSSSAKVRMFVERIAQHRNFAGELAAMKDAVEGVLETMKESGPLAQDLRQSGMYADFKVKAKLVANFQSTIESYTILISQLQHTNSLSNFLLPGNWTDETKKRLKDIAENTAQSIVDWRNEIIVADRVAANMKTLASIDNK